MIYIKYSTFLAVSFAFMLFAMPVAAEPTNLISDEVRSGLQNSHQYSKRDYDTPRRRLTGLDIGYESVRNRVDLDLGLHKNTADSSNIMLGDLGGYNSGSTSSQYDGRTYYTANNDSVVVNNIAEALPVAASSVPPQNTQGYKPAPYERRDLLAQKTDQFLAGSRTGAGTSYDIPSANEGAGSHQVFYFPHGSAKLGTQERQALEALAQEAKARGAQIRVIRHASKRSRFDSNYKRFSSNLDVSSERAVRVSKQLAKHGVPGGMIETVAMSHAIPNSGTAEKTGEAADRRVEIYVYQ